MFPRYVMLVKVDVASLYKGLWPWKKKKKKEKEHHRFVFGISIRSALQLGKLRHYFCMERWIRVSSQGFGCAP